MIDLFPEDIEDAPVAHYEYDPFGGTVSSSGAYASENSFKFSTKYQDPETGLYYYGYRYYSPETGKWLNRDPIGEQGGFNLYVFVGNEPMGQLDYLGMVCAQCPRTKGRNAKGRVRSANNRCGHEYRTWRKNPSYTPRLNGCGSADGLNVPDNFPGYSFTDACNRHDECYGTCGNKKASCDDSLLKDLKSLCKNVDPYFRNECYLWANTYYAGVALGGYSAYQSAQDDACEWKPCCKN